VNAVHPGWLKTDMGGPHAPEAVEVGAQRVIHVALDVPQHVTGRFFVDGAESSW
jgi:hypothetical protein